MTWKNHNTRNFNGDGKPSLTPLNCLGKAGKYASSRPINTNWIRPPLNSIKLNTDRSVKGNPAPSAAAGVFRNHNGNWIFGFTHDLLES